MLDQSVSPPRSGTMVARSTVHMGGCWRNVMSACQASILVGFSGVLSRMVISG